MEQNETILDYIVSLFNAFSEFISFLGSSLFDGLNFFISMFMSVPKLLIAVFNELPYFYKVGFTGAFSCLLLVLFLKVLSLVRIK